MVALRKKPKYPLNIKSVGTIPEANKRFELNDRFGHTCATPIVNNGLETPYDMVWKSTFDSFYRKNVWVPVGSVGRDWQPIQTSKMVTQISDQLTERGILKSITEKTAPNDSKSTTHRIDFVIDHPIEMPGKARDASSDFVTQEGDNEVFYPQLTLWNGYSGCCGLRGNFGLYRFICSNGMEIPFLTGKTYNLHTLNSAHNFLNRFMNQDWTQACNKLEILLRSTRDTEMTEEMMQAVLPKFSQHDKESWESYSEMDNTVGGMINFLTYQKTHNASIMSENKYQAILKQVVKGQVGEAA